MPHRPCLEPGCPRYATGRGRCDEHRKAKERDRSRVRRKDAMERNRFYARKHWLIVARRKKFENPICEHCDRELATEVHHEPPLKLLLARGLNPYADEFLVSLCHACHAKQTRLEQPPKAPELWSQARGDWRRSARGPFVRGRSSRQPASGGSTRTSCPPVGIRIS